METDGSLKTDNAEHEHIIQLVAVSQRFEVAGVDEKASALLSGKRQFGKQIVA